MALPVAHLLLWLLRAGLDTAPYGVDPVFKLGSSLYNPDLDALQAYNCSLLERPSYNLTGGAGRQAALCRGKGGGIDHLPWALGWLLQCLLCKPAGPVQSENAQGRVVQKLH